MKREIFKIDKEINIYKTLYEKIETSLEVIEIVYKKAQEQEVPLFVNFSGGKDSSAVLLLAKEIAPKDTEAIYMTTRMEIPGTIEFVQQEADRMGVYLHITDPVDHYMGDFGFGYGTTDISRLSVIISVTPD